MNDKYIKLLQARIDKLQEPDFDLEAWKSGTITTIERIFGEGNPRLKKVDGLKVDYSSWALRDATSRYNPMETCKRKGKEILSTFIEEIDLLGVEDDRDPAASLKEALPGKSDEIDQLLKDGDKEGIRKLLAGQRKDVLVGILSKVVAG